MFVNNNNNLNSLSDLNSDCNSISNWAEKLSLSDISVGEILDTYKNDTDLLKHILAAKTEEDKRRAAEEIRRAEEARLQSKFIDLQLDQNRRSSLLDDTNTSLGLSATDWLSQVNSNDLLSPTFMNNTPPSPSQLQPLSPYTLFEVPFADLNLSAPSSPEPNNASHPPPILVEKVSLTDDPPPPPPSKQEENSDSNTNNTTNNANSAINSTNAKPLDATTTTTTATTDNTDMLSPPPPPPPAPSLQVRERGSCKRTLSRTRSTRKPSIRVLSKKRYQQPSTISHNSGKDEAEQAKEELPLDHDKVMEALRAKLQRSTQQQKEQNNVKEEYTSMSPSGILLLDLKNPKKSFPIRPKATPRASVVRKPNSFISAHKPKEQTL
ncbi:ATP-dependent RNA helicase [Mucor circinelloides]